MAAHKVICIARQFGSGGHDIGHAVSEALSIPFYDKELLRAAADKSGILQELFEKADEKPATAGLHPMAPPGPEAKAASFGDYLAYMPNDRMQNFVAQVIREAADKSSCVIIGRCADYILRGRADSFSVFIHMPLEMRIKRVARMHNLDEDAARHLVRKTDRSRANYYNFYTDRDWAAAENYDLVLDAGRLGTEKAVALVSQAAELYCG